MIYVVPHVQNKQMKILPSLDPFGSPPPSKWLGNGSATAKSVDCELNVGCAAATRGSAPAMPWPTGYVPLAARICSHLKYWGLSAGEDALLSTESSGSVHEQNQKKIDYMPPPGTKGLHCLPAMRCGLTTVP
jgi:hypothetical protein